MRIEETSHLIGRNEVPHDCLKKRLVRLVYYFAIVVMLALVGMTLFFMVVSLLKFKSRLE